MRNNGEIHLPRGWARVRVREIGEVRLGRQRSPANRSAKHPRPYLRAANVTWEGLDLSDVNEMDFPPSDFVTYQLRAGDVLLSEASGSPTEVGKPAVWNNEIPGCCFQNTLIRVRSLGPTPKFLRYRFLRDALMGTFADAAKGVGIRHLGAERFGELEFAMPPLAEQDRIVAEIEKQFTRLDAGVEALNRLRAHLKRYRASVLKAACEGRLVPTEAELAKKDGRDFEPADKLLARILKERRARWEAEQLARLAAAGKTRKDDGWKARYEEARSPTPGDTPLPQGWAWATYDQISRRVTVGHVGPMKSEYVASGVPFLRSQNVRENRFDPEGLLYISPGFHSKLAKSVLRPGDIAVVRSGAVGVACVIPDSLPEANCSDLVLIQGPAGLAPRYGAYYLNSLARRAVKAGQVGIALTHFNTKSVAALTLALPPFAEQQRIVAEVDRRLSVLDELEAAHFGNARRAGRLRQSILKRAFEGKLVSQDPKDEPASVLLDRIRAERLAKVGGDGSARRSGRRSSRSKSATTA